MPVSKKPRQKIETRQIPRPSEMPNLDAWATRHDNAGDSEQPAVAEQPAAEQAMDAAEATPEHAPGGTKTYSVTIDGVEHKDESEEPITHVVIGRRRRDLFADVFAPIWTPGEEDERAFRSHQRAAATGSGLSEWGLARAKAVTEGGTVESYLRAERARWIAQFKEDVESGQFDFQAFGWTDAKWIAEETADHARKDGWTDLQVVKVGSAVWTSSGKPAAGIRCNWRV